MDKSTVIEPSGLLVKWFFAYGRRYVRRHFHAVRVTGVLPDTAKCTGPIVVYLNHPSWWDPMACLVAADHFFPGRTHFAPMDALALRRYGMFKRLGFFSVDQASASRGGVQFLRTGLSILRREATVLWVTAQGTFTDARQRPVRLMPGLARLLTRADVSATVIPLAIEYSFWQERTPELLLGFGDPVVAEQLGTQRAPAEQWQLLLEARLTRAMDDLARKASERNPSAFDTILHGRVGVGGVYDLSRRIVAVIRRERFTPEHEART